MKQLGKITFSFLTLAVFLGIPSYAYGFWDYKLNGIYACYNSARVAYNRPACIDGNFRIRFQVKNIGDTSGKQASGWIHLYGSANTVEFKIPVLNNNSVYDGSITMPGIVCSSNPNFKPDAEVGIYAWPEMYQAQYNIYNNILHPPYDGKYPYGISPCAGVTPRF